jgi:hypothetical protein
MHYLHYCMFWVHVLLCRLVFFWWSFFGLRFLLVLRAGANQLQTNAHSGAIFSSSESQLHGGAGLGICLIFGLSTPDAGGINPNGEIRCLRSVIINT